MSDAICEMCKEPVVDPVNTGILCQSCFDEEQTADRAGWKQYLNRGSMPGAIAAAVGLALSITVNGIDYAQGTAGVIAVTAGGAGIAFASQSLARFRQRQRIVAAIVTLVGLYEVVHGFAPMFGLGF